MSVSAVCELADQRGLMGFARESLITWAARAEKGYCWNEDEMVDLFQAAGLEISDHKLTIGLGLARFVMGKVK